MGSSCSSQSQVTKDRTKKRRREAIESIVIAAKANVKAQQHHGHNIPRENTPNAGKRSSGGDDDVPPFLNISGTHHREEVVEDPVGACRNTDFTNTIVSTRPTQHAGRPPLPPIFVISEVYHKQGCDNNGLLLQTTRSSNDINCDENDTTVSLEGAQSSRVNFGTRMVSEVESGGNSSAPEYQNECYNNPFLAPSSNIMPPKNKFSDLVKSARVASVGPLTHTNTSPSPSFAAPCVLTCTPRDHLRGSPADRRLMVIDDGIKTTGSGDCWDGDVEPDELERMCLFYDNGDDTSSSNSSENTADQNKPACASSFVHHSPCNFLSAKSANTDDEESDDVHDEGSDDDCNDLSSEDGDGFYSSGNNGLFQPPPSVQLTNPKHTVPHFSRPPSHHRGSLANVSDVGVGGVCAVASSQTSTASSSQLFSPLALSHTACCFSASQEELLSPPF